MAANGISTIPTKDARQLAKLDLAAAKRKGRVITEGGGTWSDNGIDDDTKNYYRSNNTYDITSLPDIYNGNLPGADDNPNPDGLLPKRPWVAVGVITDPGSIGEAVDGGTLADLQIWYDGADTNTYVPNATDEGQITQWTDKSNFAHNANPNGGSAKPTYEDTDLLGGYGYVEFDGNDNLSINPFTQLDAATGFTVFIVGKLLDTAGTQYFGAAESGGLNIRSNGTNFQAQGDAAGGSLTGPAVDTDWHQFTLVFDGGTGVTFRTDKGSEATGAAGASLAGGTSIYYLGAQDPSTNNLTGYIAEVIMFSRALTATEYTNVENYLSTKWGL